MRILFYFSIFAIFLSGCAHLQLPPEARVELQPAGTTQATYHRTPLKVDYGYQLNGDQMTLKGKVGYGFGIDTLYLRIAFFDAQGEALGQKLVFASGHRTRSGDDSFEVTLQVPAGATSFGFTSSEVQRSGNRN